MPERVYDDPRTEKGHEAWMNLFPSMPANILLDDISTF